MVNITLQMERCKGCGICIANCPKDALAFSNHSNHSGYEYVQVNEETCVKCGTCYIVCPDGVFVFTETITE